MTRFTHIICLIIALTLAVLASGVLMLSFSALGETAGFATVIILAVALAVVVPTAAALSSRRLLAGGQPLAGWLVFYAACLIIAGLAALAL